MTIDEMTVDEVIELMENEKACILKANTCDRDCAKCKLLRETEDLLSAYDMAIQALSKTVSRTEAKKLAWDLELETYYDNEKVVEMLDELPSVTLTSKENKWISCSEQPPKENEYYLVQNEYRDMLVAKYVKKDYWEEIYSRHKLGATDKIVAWMSLPKKYKAESEKERCQ